MKKAVDGAISSIGSTSLRASKYVMGRRPAEFALLRGLSQQLNFLTLVKLSGILATTRSETA